MVVQSDLFVAKNSRSPGSRRLIGTALDWYARYCSLAIRGMCLWTESYAAQVRPEQSKVFGPCVPQT